MKSANETNTLSVIYDLLQKTGLVTSNVSSLQVEKIAGDGSSRKFWRITDGSQKVCLAVAPPDMSATNMAEAKASRAIGLHLLDRNISVPKQYGWDEPSGVLLFEDLGDCKLHDYVQQSTDQEYRTDVIRSQYKLVLKNLVDMQIKGVKYFDSGWCWDTPKYDKQLMLTRESGYFLRAFWQDLLGNSIPSGLQEECEDLARRGATIPADYFLHRDFQSRNIMIHHEKPVFIDFQGGRLGPLSYDLASLLFDPYVNLSRGLQDEFFDYYLDALAKQKEVQRDQFKHEYLLLGLHRNLQIIGAFSFLSERRGKTFFRQFLRPAIDSLQVLMQQDFFIEYPVLKNCAKVSRQEFVK
jgi:N-acetylmuramate 1-kinase